ncbi:hypothetical protein BS78_K103000 [Paspalum vaginatum]|uniref:GRAM domain-containing protein n=1 Tax=Paspalum vaginatum TaxID=158149 RepID=A0A9W8CGH9_9POAL|nr:hypothetical protein BS78_K103000 [Paspalum vaginatum]
MEGKDGKQQDVAPPAGAPQPAPPPAAQQAVAPEAVRWGTRQMAPLRRQERTQRTRRPRGGRRRAGTRSCLRTSSWGSPWRAPPQQQARHKEDSPMEHILDFFNTWSRKAEELASNIWLNLKTAPSMSDAAMGKLSLGAKALTEGGFDNLYKQTFTSAPEEQLKKTFACYLSTATGPVAGTLYLTNMNVAFCSDRPLSFTAPSGQTAWSYYKVMIPLGKIATVEPVTMKENPPEMYVHIITVDSHDFWFMGFVSYDKAVHNLTEAVSQLHGVGAAAAGSK